MEAPLMQTDFYNFREDTYRITVRGSVRCGEGTLRPGVSGVYVKHPENGHMLALPILAEFIGSAAACFYCRNKPRCESIPFRASVHTPDPEADFPQFELPIATLDSFAWE